MLTTLLVDPDAALPVPASSDRRIWRYPGGAHDRASTERILAIAIRDLDAPWPLPLASSAARVHRDGNRVQWEDEAFARQQRLTRAVISAAVTAENRWIDEVADGVQLLCEQSSWCWPAHDDALRRHGSVLAIVADPFIDLGAGEVVGQLAWIDNLLGTQLDERYPGLRQRIRHEAHVRIIDPFLRRRDWHWLGLDGDVHNWNPWIHSNILVAALRLVDRPDEQDLRARVVAQTVHGIDRYIAALPADGAVDEGYSYWWEGAARALEAVQILAHATDGEIDALAEVPSLRETVAFPHRMHLGGAWYLNIADGQARSAGQQPWQILHRAAQRVGNTDAAAHARAQRAERATEELGLGRLVQALTDPEWLAATVSASPLPRDVWLTSTQVMVARETDGSARGLCVAAKGGHNAEHHNHNDVGSFVVASDGVPVIVDAGRPSYTAATFGPDRYDIWTMQSSWHTVPEIGGVAQQPGAGHAAQAVSWRAEDNASSLTMDIAAAYPVAGLSSWRRGIRLDRCKRSVVIEDAWLLDDEPAETSVRMLAAGTVELHDSHARITPVEPARPVLVRWPSGVRARIVTQALDDPMLTDVWGAALHRIDLVMAGRRAVTVTIELEESTHKGES